MADNEPSENDEIPPDTDIEKQYKDNETEDNQNEQENEEEEEEEEEEANQENEENQNEEENQEYRNSEEIQNYNIQQQQSQYYQQYPAGQINSQYSQQVNSYQMYEANSQAQAQGEYIQDGNENQYTYIRHLNQNYQSLQPNQIYQPQAQNISQKLIQYGQEFSNSHENIFNAQTQQEKPTVLEPIFVQVNQNNQGQNLLYQMNQQAQLYNNIINKRLLNQYGDYQSGQKSGYSQYSQEVSQSSQFRQGTSPGKKGKKIKKMKQVKNEPKDNTTSKPSTRSEISKRNISERYNRRTQPMINKVTPLVSFHDISSRKIKLKSNLNREKENLSEYVEIPREKYHLHANTETLYFEGGMNTGQYKFKGEETMIKQNDKLGDVKFKEEELLEEISRRTSKKGKKVKYEIMDKFYSLTEFERKEKKDRRYYLNKSNENEIDNSKFSGSLENYLGFGGQSLNKTRSNIEQKSENQNQISMNMKMNIQNESRQNIDLNNNKNKKVIKYNYKNKTTISPLDNYSRYLLEQINKIRIDPQSFIGVVEDAKANIKKYKYGGYIYEGRLKIALTSGESAFNETIEYLKNLDSMEILEFCPQITVPMPQTEDEIKEANYLKTKVDDMINDGINVRSFWRDVIKDPQISFLLMIVDDNGTRKGMRRKDILNPQMKYIGITSTEINGKFACYITLTNKLSIN